MIQPSPNPAKIRAFIHRVPPWPVLLLLCLLVFMPAHTVNFTSDGAWYMDHALNVAQGRGLVDVDQQTGLSTRLFFPLIMGLVYRIFGPGELVTYVVLRLFFLFNILLLYRLASRLFDRFTGLTAALLVFTSFSLSEWHTIMNLDYLLAFWLLLSIYLLYEAFERMRLPLFLLAGLAMLAAIAVKETAVVILAAPFLFWLLLPRYRRRRGLAGAALSTSLFLAAVLAYVLLRLSQGVQYGYLLGSFAFHALFLYAPTLPELAGLLPAYYEIHLLPAFYLAPLLVVASLYVLARAFFPRRATHPYRLLSIALIVFLPQTLVLGRMGNEQRPGQNFILLLLLYVALAVLVCDLGAGLRRLWSSRVRGRGAAPLGTAMQLGLVAALILVQATESQQAWTGSPRLIIDGRGSMLDHWRRYNTIAYLRNDEPWDSDFDAVADVGGWLDAHAGEGDPVLASLDTMRWLYWATHGRYPMVPVQNLIAWQPGGLEGGAPPPDASVPDVAFLAIDNPSGDWRVVRQSFFLQGLRAHAIRYVVLDTREGFLIPFLIEHPAFILRQDIDNRWVFEVLPDRLEPAPGLGWLVGQSREQWQAMEEGSAQEFEQRVLNETFGFSPGEIDHLRDDRNRVVPLDLRLQQYLAMFSKMDPDTLARLASTFEAKAQARPGATWSLVMLGHVAKLKGDGRTSWNAFEQARKRGVPDTTAARWASMEYLRRAERRMSTGAYDQVVTLLAGAAQLGLGPQEIAGELMPAVAQYRQELVAAGKGEGVVAVYQTLLDRHPNADELYIAIGETYALMEAWDRASEIYRQALARWPAYGPAHYGLGQVYLHSGRRAEAMLEFEQAIADRPQWEAPYVALIPLLVADGRGEEALALLRTAAESDAAMTWPQALIEQYDLRVR